MVLQTISIKISSDGKVMEFLEFVLKNSIDDSSVGNLQYGFKSDSTTTNSNLI